MKRKVISVLLSLGMISALVTGWCIIRYQGTDFKAESVP